MAGQLRVDELTNEAGTGAPSFPNKITPSSLGTGSPSASNFLRGDGAWSVVEGIPSGTVMLFAQTAAPTGWTKNTSTGDNTALRLVTGTASTGGSVAFTTAFASQTPSGTVSVSGSAGNTTLSTPQIPSHSHAIATHNTPYSSPRVNITGGSNGSQQAYQNSNATGGGGSHNHPLTISSATFSGSAINLAVSYVDVIRATKD